MYDCDILTTAPMIIILTFFSWEIFYTWEYDGGITNMHVRIVVWPALTYLFEYQCDND